MRRAGPAVALALLLALPAGAVAATHTASGLRDARYCEVIAVDGTPATAMVWNTLGLSDCPAAQWSALDATAVATELGTDAVVLNGPRHLLMDRATGTTGPTRTIGGLPMRRVATIRLGSGGLTRMPYTDRVITRTNTWHWNAGRTVFELVAPGGDTYVMQSYAQITDPALTLSALPSLGRRLDLPAGWRYRTRRLTLPLTLSARGSATVLQDELQDTYQLATTTRSRGPRRRRAVHVTGVTRLVTSATPGAIEDRGVLTGTPFGRGTSGVLGTLQNGALVGTFWLRYPNGSITGTLTAPFTLTGSVADLRGTARVTAGTGAYRGITAPPLKLHDRFDLGKSTGRVTIDGVATY